MDKEKKYIYIKYKNIFARCNNKVDYYSIFIFKSLKIPFANYGAANLVIISIN